MAESQLIMRGIRRGVIVWFVLNVTGFALAVFCGVEGLLFLFNAPGSFITIVFLPFLFSEANEAMWYGFSLLELIMAASTVGGGLASWCILMVIHSCIVGPWDRAVRDGHA